MHVHAYLAAAATILHAYKGTVPFATWLKNYFREHKKFGSRDRKMVSQLAFVFFRLGKAFDHLALEDKILTAVFLMANEPQALLEEMRPEWNTLVHLSPEEKLVRLHAAAEWKEMFPFPEKLTKVIDSKPFVLSHLVQPQLFLRLRPGKEEGARQKLASAGLSFKQEGPQCIALPNSTKATDVLVIDQEAVVQDFSSQQVLDLLPDVLFQKPITVWDCCAASGGKSLLLFDKHPNVKLTVSDVRESILVNLKKRFAAAGIRQPQSFIADLAAKNFRPPVSNFQLIICDAPCSGSGTWGRTPEQLVFFTADKLEHYSSLQKKIASNAMRSLAKGGYFLYITCSVYRSENEEVVAYLLQHTPLQLKAERYFIGFEHRADTLFAALFQL